MRAVSARARVSLKTILYATDFSSVAEQAVPLVLELACRYSSKVLAVHACAPSVHGLAPPESWPSPDEACEKQEAEQADRMKRLFRAVDQEAIIGKGEIWDILSAIIKQRHVDLLVVGTHGRKELEMVLLGSGAEKILRRAACPVVTVGPRVHPDPAHATHLRQILFATDFSAESHVAVSVAVSLAEEKEAHLDLLHVIECPESNVFARHEQVASFIERLWEVISADARLGLEADFLIEQGNPAEQVLNVAKKRRPDMIVLGIRHVEGDLGVSTHLPWLIAHKIISEAPCPILTGCL
jgi:nucleotide-binding universal stress UspA family protein